MAKWPTFSPAHRFSHQSTLKPALDSTVESTRRMAHSTTFTPTYKITFDATKWATKPSTYQTAHFSALWATVGDAEPPALAATFIKPDCTT